jgi:hypothetical protein
MDGSAIGGIAILLVFVAAMVMWVWALVDAIRQPEDRLRTGSRLMWVLVIAITHFIGAVLYLIFGRPVRPQPAL